jgi:hypothetical protein
MVAMPSRRPNGPIEDHTFPSTIEARVISPGPNPRIHGFGVEDDLSLHYRYPELVLIALTGNAPDEKQGRAFDIALQFLAPLAVAEAPAHAAVLARICGAPSSSILAVACVTLVERARHVVGEHAELLAWLASDGARLPARFRADGEEDRVGVDRLRLALERAGVHVPRFDEDPTRWAALFFALHFAGLCRVDQYESVLVMASIAPVVAEAHAHVPGALGQYPIDLPAFIYTEER